MRGFLTAAENQQVSDMAYCFECIEDDWIPVSVVQEYQNLSTFEKYTDEDRMLLARKIDFVISLFPSKAPYHFKATNYGACIIGMAEERQLPPIIVIHVLRDIIKELKAIPSLSEIDKRLEKANDTRFEMRYLLNRFRLISDDFSCFITRESSFRESIQARFPGYPKIHQPEEDWKAPEAELSRAWRKVLGSPVGIQKRASLDKVAEEVQQLKDKIQRDDISALYPLLIIEFLGSVSPEKIGAVIKKVREDANQNGHKWPAIPFDIWKRVAAHADKLEHEKVDSAEEIYKLNELLCL